MTISDFSITQSGSQPLKAGFEIGTFSGSHCFKIVLKNLDFERFEEWGINVRNAYHVYMENLTIHDATNIRGG